MTAYRVLAADLFGTVREEIPFQDFKFSKVLNAPGAFSGSMNLFHPKCTRENLDPGRTAIYVERDGTIVWGGILWTAKASDSGKSVAVGAEGFWSYFRRRLIRETLTFAAVDQLAIFQALITYAQAQPGGNIGVTVGAEVSGVLRDRTYWSYERKPLGEAGEQLSAVLNGFDFAIGCAWAGDTIVKTLQLFYPQRGSRTSLVFDLGTNVTDLEWDIDGTLQANAIDVLGAGEGDDMLIATAADTTALSEYPLLEASVSSKDVSVQDTLDAQAGALIIAHAFPVETVPTLVKRSTTELGIGAFTEGDEVQVRASGGFFDLSSYYRIVSYEVAVDVDGTETVTPAFGPTEALTQ